MAIGDDAALAGMRLVAGSEPANTLDSIANESRDYIANFGIKPGTALPIARGGTGATTAPAAVTNLGIPKWASEPTGNPSTLVLRWSNGRMSTLDPTLGLEVVNLQTLNRTRDALLETITELVARVEKLERKIPK